jgi:hypothetical protein
MPVYKPKKAKSPTGRASKVNPDVGEAMRGVKGKRPVVKKKKKAVKVLNRATKMDKGLPLTKQRKR